MCRIIIHKGHRTSGSRILPQSAAHRTCGGALLVRGTPRGDDATKFKRKDLLTNLGARVVIASDGIASFSTERRGISFICRCSGEREGKKGPLRRAASISSSSFSTNLGLRRLPRASMCAGSFCARRGATLDRSDAAHPFHNGCDGHGRRRLQKGIARRFSGFFHSWCVAGRAQVRSQPTRASTAGGLHL